MNFLNKRHAIAALALVSAVATTAAQAAPVQTSVVYEFKNVAGALYDGSTLLPNTSGIFATATFTTLGNNQVSLTLSGLGTLGNSLYADLWTFNVATGSTVTGASYQSGVSGGAFLNAVNGVTNGPILNSSNVDTNLFDLGFNFSSLNPNQISTNSSVTYLLSGTNLSAASFLASDAAGLYAAVHVSGGGTGRNGIYVETLNTDGVATVAATSAVPEPATISVLGLGLAGMAAARRRKSAKK